jgi:hypothetical protein
MLKQPQWAVVGSIGDSSTACSIRLFRGSRDSFGEALDVLGCLSGRLCVCANWERTQAAQGLVGAETYESKALILLAESLDVGFAVGIEEFLAALLPRCSEFRRCDVPIRPAFPGDRTQVLAEILQRRPAQEPVAVVDLVNDKTGLKNNHVRDHRIVNRIGVFGDVEIFLNHTSCIGEERPVGADSRAVFVRLGDIVGANRYKPAVGNLKFTMELNKPFGLPAVLGAKASAA